MPSRDRAVSYVIGSVVMIGLVSVATFAIVSIGFTELRGETGDLEVRTGQQDLEQFAQLVAQERTGAESGSPTPIQFQLSEINSGAVYAPQQGATTVTLTEGTYDANTGFTPNSTLTTQSLTTLSLESASTNTRVVYESGSVLVDRGQADSLGVTQDLPLSVRRDTINTPLLTLSIPLVTVQTDGTLGATQTRSQFQVTTRSVIPIQKATSDAYKLSITTAHPDAWETRLTSEIPAPAQLTVNSGEDTVELVVDADSGASGIDFLQLSMTTIKIS